MYRKIYTAWSADVYFMLHKTHEKKKHFSIKEANYSLTIFPQKRKTWKGPPIFLGDSASSEGYIVPGKHGLTMNDMAGPQTSSFFIA